MDIYEKLNPKQKQAVDTIDGPLLVLAGPGTGKTQLLSARVMRILEQTDTPASSILCLTFTENGALNMENRLAQFIGEQAYQVQISTYHSFAQSIIGQFPEHFRQLKLEKVADEISKYQFIESIKDQMKPNNILKSVPANDLLSVISQLKRALITPDQLRQLAEANKLDLDKFNQEINQILKDVKSLPGSYQKSVLLFEPIDQVLKDLITPTNDKLKSFFIKAEAELTKALEEGAATDKSTPLTNWKKRFLDKDKDGNWKYKENQLYYWTIELANLLEQYSAILHKNSLYDFEDMIIKTIETIERVPELKFNLQEKYLYILLDEYQDTNAAQSRLIELITDNPVHEGRPNVMAVGDDDQAIYAFQGAEYSNMVDFYYRYRNTKIINLTENYRSHQHILDFATNIAEQIDSRLHHKLDQSISKQISASNQTINNSPVKINRYDLPTAADQNQFVAEKIDQLIKNGVSPSQIAVLAPKHRFLESLTPHLASLNIAINYEKKQNILENPGIQAIITLAKTITLLSKQLSADHLLFELLSYDCWGLKTADVWQISWQAKDKSFLEIMLDYNDKTRQIALWLMAIASKYNQLSLEASFDILLGNTKIEITDGENQYQYNSPLRQFYLDNSPEQTVDFVLDINILRERFLEFANNHPSEKIGPIEQFVKMIDTYESLDLKINRNSPYNESQQSVNLMTAFAAKGLEFEHVFLLEVNQPGWASGQGNQSRVSLPDNLKFIRHQKGDRDEQLRLLFVALTRAKSNLYLVSPLYNLSNKPIKRLEFLQEIELDGQVLAKNLPENYQAISRIDSKAELKTLENNLLDNFTAWRARHLETRLEYRDLLQNRLENFRLSPTSLNSYLDLEYGGPDVFFINNVLRFPGEYDPRLAYGTLIHATLEQVQALYNQGKTVDTKQLMEIFEQKLTDCNLTQNDHQTMLSWAKDALPEYFKTREQIFKISNNYQVRTELACNNTVIDEAKIGGKIDRVEIDKQTKTITIVDYKTSKPYQKLDLSKTSLYNNLRQLYCYKAMVESLPEFIGFKVTKWRLEFVSTDPAGKTGFLEGDFKDSEDKKVRQLIKIVYTRAKQFQFDRPDLPDTLPGRKKFEKQLLEEAEQV